MESRCKTGGLHWSEALGTVVSSRSEGSARFSRHETGKCIPPASKLNTIHMKTNRILTIGAFCAGLLILGCSKEESTSTSTPATPASSTPTVSATESAVAEAQKAAAAAAEQAKQTAEKVATETKQAAQQAATDAQQNAAKATDAATQQTQSLIEKAKTYVSEKKYQEALTSLQQLSKVQLTLEQQKVVEDLKAQVQKLIATDAAKSASGLVPK